jgi:hypothetical protein
MAFAEAGKPKENFNKMKWERLTRNLCPGCRCKTVLESKGNLVTCPDNCGFKISPEKMQKLVMDILEDQGRDDEWEEWNSICGGCGKPDMICSCY